MTKMLGFNEKETVRPFAGLVFMMFLAGCQPSTENRLLKPSGMAIEDTTFYPSDAYVRLGKVHYRNGDYGLAEEQYRKAVEVTPRDAEAWLGLAASYDQLRRFDLADRAYEQVFDMSSNDPAMLNNAGYSQLLRGNIENARKLLLRAYELAPDNIYISNNLKLLGESKSSVKRVTL
jgi:Flp pilus assembly protein TadD